MILDGRRLTSTEYLRLMINLETEDVGDIDTYVVGLALSLLPPPPAPTLIKIPPAAPPTTDVDSLAPRGQVGEVAEAGALAWCYPEARRLRAEEE